MGRRARLDLWRPVSSTFSANRTQILRFFNSSVLTILTELSHHVFCVKGNQRNADKTAPGFISVGYAPAGSVSPRYINSWPAVQLQNSAVVFNSASGSGGSFCYADRLSASSAWGFHRDYCVKYCLMRLTRGRWLFTAEDYSVSSYKIWSRVTILHIITSQTTRFMVAFLALRLKDAFKYFVITTLELGAV